jgi:predicted transcriptional regulator
MPEELKDKKREEKKEEKVEEKAATEAIPEAKKRGLDQILLREKPSKLLTLLLQDKQWHISALARDSNQSYIYATTLIKQFETAGLVSLNSNGKKRIVKLTEKGEKIARTIQDLATLTAAP